MTIENSLKTGRFYSVIINGREYENALYLGKTHKKDRSYRHVIAIHNRVYINIFYFKNYSIKDGELEIIKNRKVRVSNDEYNYIEELFKKVLGALK